MDFSLILVIATLLTGSIWALDMLVLRTRRADSGGAASEPVVVEYARSFFPIILIVLLVRSFLFEPFRIPSSSMMPTLLVGDFIFVNKYAYGLRLPVLNTKFLQVGDPHRGDVVVFRLPSDPSTNYIKRLIGLPGDVITYRGKQVFVNGDPVPIELNGWYEENSGSGPRLALETIDGVEHKILILPGRFGREGEFRVPDGHFFMMGDNRDNSRDSRYEGVGFVPEENLVGKAVAIWMNWDWSSSHMDLKRIGDRII